MKISSILLSAVGERTIINYETPHEHIFQHQKELDSLKKARIVYVSNLPKVSLEERNHMMSFLNQHKIPCVLNLGILDCRRPIQQLIPLLHKTNILILNSHEFGEMIKHDYQSINFKKDVRKYIDVLCDKTLIITDGEKGSYGYFDETVHHLKALVPKQIIDTTGAGDGYTAGFIAGYLKHTDIPQAMEIGGKYACKVLEKVGAN